MIFRAIKEGGETIQSLESQDLTYLLKINEYLDIQTLIEKDIEQQSKTKKK